MPRLVNRLGAEEGTKFQSNWGETLDQSEVLVERVIAYWSRVCKGPETRYSATEREALAAKEALIKFTPFIEGENITLVTDHATLQWARTFENYNRRLAAWGLVFAAFPDLTIVHRAGLQHSNIDPLTRLERTPEEVSPLVDNLGSVATTSSLIEPTALW